MKKLNQMEQTLMNSREKCKSLIVTLITLIYIKHNGNFPNWAEDEEISVEDSEIGSTSRISVEVTNTYDESTYIEKWTIEEYHINVNGDLFFWCNDTLEEIEWTNVSTDELVSIYTKLYNYVYKYYKEVKLNLE